MNTGYVFALDCPDCGKPLTHQAYGEASPLIAQAVAVCDICAKEYLLRLTLQSIGVTRPDRDTFRSPAVATILAHEGSKRRSFAR